MEEGGRRAGQSNVIYQKPQPVVSTLKTEEGDQNQKMWENVRKYIPPPPEPPERNVVLSTP